MLACGSPSRLAEHVSAYCGQLAAVLADLDARGAAPHPIAVLGFESWPAVYSRFVFCADARADATAAAPMVTEFRQVVDALNERPTDAPGPRLARLRALAEQVQALPLRR